MLPLNEFKKKNNLLNADYMKSDDGTEMRNIVVAKYKGDYFLWYQRENVEEFQTELVPIEAIDTVASLQNNFNFTMSGDARAVEQAKEKVFPGIIEGVIEAAPIQIDTKKKEVTFSDLLVVRSLNPNHFNMKVYVPSVHAGQAVTANIRRMIGQIVPVTIDNLNERKFEEFKVSKGIKNNYVASGNISLAEWLMNESFAKFFKVDEDGQKFTAKEKERLRKRQSELRQQEFKGIVTRVANAGVWVLGKHYETVFIPYERLNFEAKSRVKDRRESISQNEEVSYKLEGVHHSDNTPKQLENFLVLGKSQSNVLLGESISFHEAPIEMITALIDKQALVGKTFTAFLISYDSVKGHFIELEAFPGVLVKLQNHRDVKPSLIATKEPIVVAVQRARYRMNDNGKPKLTVQCRYVSRLGNLEAITGFFDF